MAVVPGSACVRESSHPSPLATTITENVPIAKIGQSRAILPNTATGRLLATMTPMTPCAPKKSGPGIPSPPPVAASPIAAIIGPSSSAAGRPMSSSNATRTSETPMRIAHRAVAGPRRCEVQKALDLARMAQAKPGGSARAEVFGSSVTMSGTSSQAFAAGARGRGWRASEFFVIGEDGPAKRIVEGALSRGVDGTPRAGDFESGEAAACGTRSRAASLLM